MSNEEREKLNAEIIAMHRMLVEINSINPPDYSAEEVFDKLNATA